MAKGAKKKTTLSSEERKRRAQERAFKRQARTIFDKTGFKRIAEVADKEFSFQSSTSDFDDCYISENLIVFNEYTLSNESGTGEHFKNKAHLYKKILDNPGTFLEFMCEKFSDLKSAISSKYHASQLRLRIVYFSKFELKSEHADLEPRVVKAPPAVRHYFRSLASDIERSAKFELADWLQLPAEEIGRDGEFPTPDSEDPYPGSLLPEAHSEFPKGYKIVSFYVTPGALLKRAYVLRHDGWRDDAGLYQRMIDRKKIRSIRAYLKSERRVFVNNVIVTLPHDTRLDNLEGEEVNAAELDKTTPVVVKLRNRHGSLGIVDGQHRVFSYFEAVKDDSEIALFRGRQNMLATGIIYPPQISDFEKRVFEARLFLEINSKQNSAKSDLKQAITAIISPFADEALAQMVISKLARSGPLEGLVQKSYFDTNVLKTSSTVSFALARMMRIEGDEAIIQLAPAELQTALEDKTDVASTQEIVQFAVTEINKFLGAIRATLPTDEWRIKSKKAGGILSVTTVNAFLILFRKVYMRDGLGDFVAYKKNLSKLTRAHLTNYHSSQYNRMAENLLKNVYGK